MRLRRSLPTGLAALATLAAFVTLPAPAAVADTTTDTYIVQLKAGVSADKVGGKIMGATARVIHKVFQGGIVKLTAAQAQALSTNPDVKSIHKDAVVKATGTETNAPWDLDVLDNTTGALDTTYSYPNNGSGVTVYVVDSGILRTHTEFANITVAAGINYVDNVDPSTIAPTLCAAGKTADTTVNPANTNDDNGHGTAVSSLIAGATWGASKGVTIVPVRVLNCAGSGTESDIISAADWIASNRTPGVPAVANLSFGVATSQLNGDTSLEDTFQGLINSGVTVVAAAGNDSADACTESPASLRDAITVASVTKTHAESTWSNYGPCVDLYAPGEYVYVADKKSIYSQAQGSGTSFSAPLVTAAAAQVLHDHPTWTPAQVSADITSRATPGLVVSARVPNTTANLLLNVTGHFTGADPSVTGAVYAGETATATLHWVPTPATVSYQWYRNGVAIPGAISATYASTSDDVNLPITVTATASDSGFVPISGTSDSWTPQLGLPMTPVVPTVSGTPAVSYTLTGDPGTGWDPADVTLAYQWRRDGVDISGATALTYAPVAADVNHTLTFKVTGTKPGYASTSGESSSTAPIQGGTSELAYEAFVKASYQDFLSRQPSPSELLAQSNALSSGAISRADFLTSMSRSDEWLSAIVTKMYEDTLGRGPDPAGLSGWVTALRTNQWTVAQVASFFYASNEYYTDHAGNSDSTWVTLLYQKLLNRSPDPLGLAQWVQQTSKNGRSWVASNFYQSDESRMKRVQALYQTLLSRDPDPVGWAWWKQTILTTGDLVLATQIAGSDEYWNKAHVRY